MVALRAAGDDVRATAAARLAGAAQKLLPMARLEGWAADLERILLEKHPSMKREIAAMRKRALG